MKILLVIRALNQGGAQRQLVSAADYLQKCGHQVAVCTFYAGGIFEAEAHGRGLRLIALHKTKRWQFHRPLIDLFETVRREAPDVVYSFLPLANVGSALAKIVHRRIRLVWGIRSTPADLRNYDAAWRLLALVEDLLRRFPDQIIVNSFQSRKALIQKGVRSDRLAVIPNGIDTDRFQPAPSLRQAARAKLHFADDEIIVAAVARLDPKKDHVTFVQAAKLVLSQVTNVRFACIGIDSQNVRLPVLCQAIAQEGLTDKFVLIGPCQAMPAIYNAVDVVCLSSAYGEGFPNVIGEAMACGTPCVATDSGDAPLIVGDAGTIVPSRDPEALADGLMKTITALQVPAGARQLKEDVRQRIVQRYGLNQMGWQTATRLEALVRT